MKRIPAKEVNYAADEGSYKYGAFKSWNEMTGT